MSERFFNVVAALNRLKAERPECQREVDTAVGMILGRRPGLEQKYDALLLKLDRTYTQLEDVRDHIKQQKESPLAKVRANAKARIFCINKMLSELQWMRARNADLIKLRKPHEQSERNSIDAEATSDLQEGAEAHAPAQVLEQGDGGTR